jgi:hypothetical protein
MSNSSPEDCWQPSADKGWLPSQECTLPSAEAITAVHVGLHTRLFEAARRRMLPPESNVLASFDTMKWSVDWAVGTDEAQSLHIKQHGPFGEPPTVGTLRTNAFTVDIGPFAGLRGSIADLNVFQDGDGEMVVYDRGGYMPIYPRMSQRQMKLGIEVLRAFVNGEIPANRQRLERYIRVTGAEGSVVSAEETRLWQGDTVLYSGSIVQVDPRNFGDLDFKSQLLGDQENATYEYLDRAIYKGRFDIELGRLVVGSAGRDPQNVHSSPRSPWRLLLNHRIFPARLVLTTGRLKGVVQRGEEALAQLARYHEAYVAQFPQPGRPAGAP